MCTILALYRAHPDYPLIIAANRDEHYDRPATPVGLLEASPLRIIGGRDLLYGGTWMGLNAAGLFVGLTNLRGGHDEQASRGEIVLDALRQRTPDAVDERLERLTSERNFRPFNLLYGGLDALHVARLDVDGRLEITPLEPGSHVIPSATRHDDSRWPKVARAFEALEGIAAEAASGVDIARVERALIRALGDRSTPPLSALPERSASLGGLIEAQLQALYVTTPTYGTRSSTLATLSHDAVRYAFCEGFPEPDRFTRYEGLLQA